MNATASTTDFRKWTISYTSYGTFIQVAVVEVQGWEGEDHGATTFSTTEAWSAAKQSQPDQIIVCGATGTKVYHSNGTVEKFPALNPSDFYEDAGNKAEAELAMRESKADEEAAEPTSRVGRVFIDTTGNIYRVKKSQSGYLKAQMFNIDMWVNAWNYSTSTWRELTAGEAAAFGHSTHHCVFCYKSLTTTESTTVGYGPRCAANNGLPWG